MWKLQLESYKKTQMTGSLTMNAFIHKCDLIRQLLPSVTLKYLKWERTAINSTAWVLPPTSESSGTVHENVHDGEFETKSVGHLVNFNTNQVGNVKKFI